MLCGVWLSLRVGCVALPPQFLLQLPLLAPGLPVAPCGGCRWIVVPIMIVWSSWASIPFISGAVPTNRRALAVYPMVLLYTSLGWFALMT